MIVTNHNGIDLLAELSRLLANGILNNLAMLSVKSHGFFCESFFVGIGKRLVGR